VSLVTVIQRLESLKCDPHKNGDGWKSCCPAHEDANPSLSIKEGDDGKVLLNCHVGCGFKAIVKALGIDQNELFAPSTKKTAGRSGFSTLDDAIKWKAGKEGATVKARWKYNDAFHVVRFDKGADKTFCPFRRDSDGWRMKDPVGKLPLYHLAELAAAPIIWVLEGEKCADLVRDRLGLVATTSSHGSKAADKTDWSPLAGKAVYLIPDNDEAGEKYVATAAGLLGGLSPKPTVKVVKIPVANVGDDVEQWLDGVAPDSWGPDECRAELERLAAAAPEWTLPTIAPAAPGAPDNPILNRDRKWVSCLHNSLLWLGENGYGTTVRYDRFRHIILINSAPLDDTNVITINAEIEASTRSAWSQEHVRSALMEIARHNEFSSLTAWLDSLKWDGIERIRDFFPKAYGAEATDYSAACADVQFLSGVARAYQPGCQADVMVVLIGPQGLGKSMGMAALCPDPSWYADDLGCDLFDRKAGEGLRGKWLIEFSEFSRINRATLDVAKAFVSRRSDYYRPAYGRVHKDYPRTCVFVGTTNDDHPLHDRENRRFMPIHCVKADQSWIAANRDQLWAEAVTRYQWGDKWWVTVPTTLAQVAEKAEEARQADSWIEILDDEIGHMIAITMRIAADALKIRPDQLNRSTETRIGFALKSLGYIRKRARVGGKLAYEWRK
jgi:hypothetical protein